MSLIFQILINLYLIKILKCEQFLTVDNFFHKSSVTLQFVGDFRNADLYFESIFQKLASSQYKNPVVIDDIPDWNMSSSRYDLKKLRDFSIPLKNIFSKFRFTQTVAVIVDISVKNGIISPNRIRIRLNYLLNMIPFSKENPSYIFFHLNKKYLELNLENAEALRFPKTVALTSIYLFFGANYPLSLFCMRCEKFQVLQLPSEVKTLEGIDDFWKLKRNTENFESRICTANFIIANRSDELRRICANSVILNQYNFSGHLYDPPIFGVAADREFNELQISQRRPDKYEWYVEAVFFLPFSYVIVVEKNQLNFQTLLMPFDVWIWAHGLLSMVGIVGILNLGTKSRLRSSLFWAISVLLDQTDGDGRTMKEFLGKNNNKRHKFSVLLTITLYYFVAFVLGMFYKGSLFSSLTSSTLPAVPNSLRSMLEVKNLPIITTTTGVTPNNEIISILKLLIIPDLLDQIKEGDNSSFFTRLQKKTRFLPGNKFKIGRNISRENRKNLQIVVLDTTTELNSLTQAITLFSSNTAILRNNEMLPFISRVPWFGVRNVIYPLFAEGLGRLVQAGIYERWQTLEEIQPQMEEAGKGLEDQGSYREYFIKILLQKQNKDSNFQEAVPVKMTVLKYPVAFCGILISFGFLIFIGEVSKEWIIKVGVCVRSFGMFVKCWVITWFNQVKIWIQHWIWKFYLAIFINRNTY